MHLYKLLVNAIALKYVIAYPYDIKAIALLYKAEIIDLGLLTLGDF